MRKVAILTFDYEVFLGSKTGTIKSSVIEPTDQILEVLVKNKSKAIFFVDATWLLFLRDNCKEDFSSVSRQLKRIVASGSSVELHLHPQWRNAYLNNGEIIFRSFDNYSLQSLSKKEVIDLFHRSIDLLESITLQSITCFRAGGFCIKPFLKVMDAFEMFGIRYDFSVAPGMLLKAGNNYDYDFSDAPLNTSYRFQTEVTQTDSEGKFVEIPLSTYANNALYRLINKLLLKIEKDRIFGDGIGIQEKSHYFIKSLGRRMSFSRAFLTFDNTSIWFFKYLVNTSLAKVSPLVITSHPKTFSRQALLNLSFVAKNFETLNSSDLEKAI